MTVWRMCTHTHTQTTNTEDVTLCVFARQQYLQDGASLLCQTYIVCLVSNALNLKVYHDKHSKVHIDSPIFTEFFPPPY